MDNSDCLSSQCVLTYSTALYVPSVCAVQRRHSYAFPWRTCDWSTRWTRPKLIEPAPVCFHPRIVPAGKYGLVPAGSNQEKYGMFHVGEEEGKREEEKWIERGSRLEKRRW